MKFTKNIWKLVIDVIILGQLMADTSSKRQKNIYVYIVKYITLFLYIEQKSFLNT